MQDLLGGDNLIRVHITTTTATTTATTRKRRSDEIKKKREENMRARNKMRPKNGGVQDKPKIIISGWARFDKSGQANKKPYRFNINHFRSISISFCFH